MINLMLTGRAVANVFNGDIECNKSGRKLVNNELHSVLLLGRSVDMIQNFVF